MGRETPSGGVLWATRPLWLGETSKEVSVYPGLGLYPDQNPRFVGSVFVSRPVGLGLYPDHKRRVAHISLVFREMWDSTNVSL